MKWTLVNAAVLLSLLHHLLLSFLHHLLLSFLHHPPPPIYIYIYIMSCKSVRGRLVAPMYIRLSVSWVFSFFFPFSPVSLYYSYVVCVVFPLFMFVYIILYIVQLYVLRYHEYIIYTI